ncbi:hypothetical protein F2Q69_00012716 [Brassica cretica]|uniref:Uncharacterized protein n=1 Tax=Brassica cretica TaxID=69181 RepID=A0A8S9QIU9_BRACR|nr:hypothetical protein F2Q69_00012716 [Brassica cretica]
MESAASCNAVKILIHEEFAAKHPHPASPDKVRIALRADTSIDRHGESSIDRHSEAPSIDNLQRLSIDENLLPTETPSYDGEDPMEEDRVPTGRTLRRRKEKVAKHLKRGANDKEKERVIAACHCKNEYETDYSASIKTHTATSIGGGHQKSTTIPQAESADEDHQESFAVEASTYAPGADNLRDKFTDEELLNMHKRDGTDQIRAVPALERTRFSHPIDKAIRPSIDSHHQQSIDNNNATSINNRPIPNTTVREKDKFDHQFLTPDEFGIFRDPDGYAKAIDGRTLHVSRKNITNILQTANGADNLFMHHRNNQEHKATKEFYDTAGGIHNNFIQKSRHPTQPSIDVAVPTSVDRQPEFSRRAYDLFGNRKFYWEEKDEYGVFRDDQRYARDLNGNTIRLHNTDI